MDRPRDVHQARHRHLDDLEASGTTGVYCLGNLVGYGPHPNWVIDLLLARNVLSVLGNYDEGVGWETGDRGCFYPDAETRRRWSWPPDLLVLADMLRGASQGG